MSFGRRLILFFLLIVVVPMLAVAGLLLQVTAESRNGKADARLASGLDTAIRLDEEGRAQADRVAAKLAKDPQLAAALRSGKPAQLQTAANRLAAQPGVVAVSVQSVGGANDVQAGPEAVGFASVQLQDPDALLGILRVSQTPADAYVKRVAALTGREAVLIADSQAIGGTVELPSGSAPAVGETKEVEVGDEKLRARSVALGDEAELVLLGPVEDSGLPAIDGGIVLVLAFLLAAALLFTFFLARTMQSLHELVSQQAVTDELTGLSNPRRFRALLANEVARAKRFGHDLSLLMLDLDDFKRVNDTHGHLQGDDVLRAVAAAVREESREVDEPARYGGEELAVALPETGPEGAIELAERIRARIEEVSVPLRSGSGSTGVTVSIGVAGLGESTEGAESLIAAADGALYEAKRAGKNRSSVAGDTQKRAPTA